jgi:hypothetical protein
MQRSFRMKALMKNQEFVYVAYHFINNYMYRYQSEFPGFPVGSQTGSIWLW